MLALTRKCDYALIALSHLYRVRDEVTSAREIAALYHMPLPALMNILKELARQEIVTSVRGAKGGYRISDRATRLSLKELLVALEGPIRLVQCVGAEGGTKSCQQRESCPVMAPALRLQKRLEQFLDQVPLAEIIDGANLGGMCGGGPAGDSE